MAKSILVIDDDPAVHDILTIHLKHLGYAVFNAPDGARGVEEAKRVRPDMIILDFEMPGDCGETVFDNLRKHPAMTEIPVVFLSSLRLSNQVGRVPMSRNVRFLKKPIEVKELLAVIESFVGKA